MAIPDQNEIVEQITSLYAQISKLKSLKPSNEFDTLLEQLISTCLPTEYTNIDIKKMSQRVQDMRATFIKQHGEAVGHLEQHFSKILGSLEDDNPLDHLHLFPKYTNYLDLSKLEFDLLSQHTTKVPTKIAFVGSGPMPHSSIILAKFHLPNTTFHNFDIDAQANVLASCLVSRDPDLSHRMIFHTSDLLSMTTEVLSGYDVVFLASLVGSDEEAKVQAIEHLEKHMAPGAFLMLRSAHGLRGFLYHIVDPCDLKGFEILTIYHPMINEVIHSVVIARKLGGQTMSGMNGGVRNSKI